MHSITTFFRSIVICPAILLLVSQSILAAQAPSRLDLYDGADNHLMYMTFAYDAAGRNSGRTIYMADGTFMRTIVINYDASGSRSNEVSYDFNGDTMYVSNYLQSSNKTTFDIQDQFKQDFAGDRVGYSNADPLKFELTYEKSGVRAASVNYMTEGAGGNLMRVEITGQSGNDTYYGLFTYDEVSGVLLSGGNSGVVPVAAIRLRASRIEVNFNLKSVGDVRCELLTLTGRRAAVLFNGKVESGRFTRHFDPGKGVGSIVGGMYLFKVSVNGICVAHSKYLHQSLRAGGVR